MENFQKIEKKLTKLVQEGRGNLYEIAVLCVELFTDSENYANHLGIKPREVVKRINELYLKDFAIDVETAVSLLEVYPEKHQWNRPVLDMIASIKSKSNDDKKPIRRSVTLAQFEEERNKRIAAEKQVEELQAQLEAANKKIRRLQRKLDKFAVLS